MKQLTTKMLTKTSISDDDFFAEFQKHSVQRIENYRKDEKFIAWYDKVVGGALPEDIGDFVDAYEQAAYCRTSCSSAYCPYDGMVRVWRDGAFQKQACERWAEYEKQKKAVEYDRRLRYANIPLLFDNATFDSYNPINDSQRKALAICEGYEPKNGIGLYICGAVGTGKTHLAIAMLREVAKVMSVYFISVPEALHFLRPPYNDNALFDKLLKIPFLVLDDLGVQKSSEWVNEQLTFILDARKNRKLATIITSNLTLEALKGGGLEAERIASRIKEMCDILLITGNDYRDQIARNRKHPTKVLS